MKTWTMAAGLICCGVAHAAPEPTTDVEELHAFAKVYGYVRWFHPSDEAAGVDWDAFAVEGARRIVAVQDREALEAELEAWFAPVAPTLDVTVPGVSPRALELPRGKVVAWQHEGYGDAGGIYQSHRTHRTREVLGMGPDWASLTASIPADGLQGREIRLTARVRFEPRAGTDRAAAWLRVDRADKQRGFFDNMGDRPIAPQAWAEVVIEGPVAEDAEKIVFGGLFSGRGAGEFDDFALFARDADGSWEPVPLPNGAFASGFEGWISETPGFRYEIVDEVARLEREVDLHRKKLFAAHAGLGEPWTAPIGAGLTCTMPLALPSRGGETQPAAPALPALPIAAADDPAVDVAAVIVAWNVARHFYPYLDVIGEPWDEVLDDALREVLDAAAAPDPAVSLDAAAPNDPALRRLVARMRDGHAQVLGAGPATARVAVRLARAEGGIVVTAASPDTGLVRGDVVVSVDGVPIEEAIAAAAAFVSGSPHWVEHRLLDGGLLLRGEADSTVSLAVRRGEEPITVALARGADPAPVEFDRPAIAELDGGVWYVDLDRASWAEIEAQLEALAAAPGVIFDLRGYPNSNHDVLAHLLTEADRTRWMFVARMVRPDQTDPAWDDFGWDMRPREPHIGGKVAWLTGPGAISYAESMMGFVEHFDLGEIVGGPTAGANGNVAVMGLPGGNRVTFTGMKVLRADGRQHHMIGIEPTVPVGRTVEGVRDGRDEVLERALLLVGGV